MSKQFHEIIGVVVCGGNSSRMMKDKSLIDYHGKPQRYYLYNLVKNICDEVIISCNENQLKGMNDDYDFIADDSDFAGHGPISGLLTIMKNNSDKSVLFIGCDYPLINELFLLQLIKNRKINSHAVGFVDQASGIPEPLITIYEQSSYEKLRMLFEKGEYSLKKFLEQSDVVKIIPNDSSPLININTQEEYEKFISGKMNASTSL